MNLEECASEEKKRLSDLAKGMPSNILEALQPIIENTAWMKAKLDEARELIKDSPVVIKYDNGGGQKGIRENPLFKEYEALWKSYMIGMCRILESMSEEDGIDVIQEDVRPKTVLQMVRNKHGKEA